LVPRLTKSLAQFLLAILVAQPQLRLRQVAEAPEQHACRRVYTLNAGAAGSARSDGRSSGGGGQGGLVDWCPMENSMLKDSHRVTRGSGKTGVRRNRGCGLAGTSDDLGNGTTGTRYVGRRQK
jgi:hypothetical protein